MTAAPDYAVLIADAAFRLRHARDWTDEIGPIMENLGKTLDISRVYLFKVHELPKGGLGQTCIADWAAPGLAPLASDDRNIDERILDDDLLMQEWAEKRRRGEMIRGHTRDLTGYLRKDFRHQRIKSFISFPIWQNGHWWGHLGFDDCVREREWTDSEDAVLRAVGYLLADAIALSASSLVMSEATRLAMMRTAPYGIIVIDEAGAIIDFNPAAERIFGQRSDDVLGRKIADTLIHEKNQAAFNYFMRKLQLGKAQRVLGQHTVTEGRHRDGAEIPIELAVTEIRHGERRLFVAYVRDLTLVRKAEQESQRQRDALHQSEKLTALGSLLAGVAHELNNPLSVVIGRAIMLEEDAKDPVQKDRLKKLREAAERCAKVSKTFLAMARQSPATRNPIQINKAVRTAIDLMTYSLRSSGIEIKLLLDERMPDVVADIDQIVQVFVNLVVNAEHAMRESPDERVLTIETGRTAEGVFAEVRDTGPGIKPEVLPRVFEPFFTTKAVGSGTGMGLAVSHGMISAHGGKLEVVPREPGQGACFRLTLPAGSEMQPVVAAPQEAKPEKLPGLHVLVVDDEPEVAELLGDILARAGHRVDRALNGAEGLRFAADTTYDAIFCDLRMPILGGRGFRQRIVVDHPRYRDRMAFVTGDLLGTIKPGEDLDGCPVIEKPFQSQAILDMLGRMATA